MKLQKNRIDVLRKLFRYMRDGGFLDNHAILEYLKPKELQEVIELEWILNNYTLLSIGKEKH